MGGINKSNLGSVTDSLGTRIDPGIENLVIELNRLGLETLASCEGHLDHGCISPWVDIESTPKISSLVNRFNKDSKLPRYLQLRLSKIYESGDLGSPYFLRLHVGSSNNCSRDFKMPSREEETGIPISRFKIEAGEVMDSFVNYISKLE